MARCVFGPTRSCVVSKQKGQSLNLLAAQSEDIARELLAILKALHSAEPASKYKSFVQAIQTAWTSRKIAETKERLDTIQKALQFHLQVTMSDDIRQSLCSLDDASRKVLVAVLQSKEDIIRQQQASEALASKRHDQVIHSVTGNGTIPSSEEDVLSGIMALLFNKRQDDRFDDIVEAHQTTFRWALQRQNTTGKTWPILYSWLSRDGGIYWISGKAGSGKSTLMKFLHQDPRLRTALKTWAGGARLVTIGFYFWNAGMDLQKSQEGLFRSLLYQVLEQEPSLGRVLFPERYRRGAKWIPSFTFHELRRAFNRLTAHSDDSFKIAMIIDGLDEFDATDLTMTELADMFIAATKTPNIKALISSRPLAPFEFTFEKQAKLRLHELTDNDITTFVHDKLGTHPRIAHLSINNAGDVRGLIEEIVDSASGVFLWVRLVVRSLLEGLQNYDTLSDLRRRLDELPRDLEKLFEHMLCKIPVEYSEQSSRIFQIVRRYHARIGSLESAALSFAEMDQFVVMGASVTMLLEGERRQLEEEVAGKLRSRCAGLLELRPREQDVTQPRITGSTAHIVDYLHKSVADFLAKNDVWQGIMDASGTDFDVNVALVRSLVMQIKKAPAL